MGVALPTLVIAAYDLGLLPVLVVVSETEPHLSAAEVWTSQYQTYALY